MIDGVMKKLMRGIKIAAEPINHHKCAHNRMGAISNNGCRVCVCVCVRETETGGGGVTEGGGATASQCHEHPKDALWLLEQLQLRLLTCRAAGLFWHSAED